MMKSGLFWMGTLVATIALGASLGAAHARDKYKMRSIDEALKSKTAKGRVNPEIKLFFGKQPYPAVANSLGKPALSRKTIISEDEEFDPCVHVFVQLVVDLQGRARDAGANAVVNIESNYKNNVVSSETEYVCVSGSMVTAAALKGELVKLAE